MLVYNSHKKVLTGGEPMTTNNRMEMTAAVVALESLKRPCKVIVTTDSQYLMKGVTQWMPNWKKRGWKTAQNAPVKNQDLWIRLDALSAKHDIEWKWVRGHADHEENIMMDQLARDAILKLTGPALDY